jgi:hypothetical protein
MTPERLQEIKHFATRFGCGNGWTGTVGTACTYLRELMDATLLPPGMEVLSSEPDGRSQNAPKVGDDGFFRLLDEMRALHVKKSIDYGTDSDPLANIRGAAVIGLEPWRAAYLRALDKVNRINRYCVKGTLANEGVRDSFLDLANYALLALRLFDEGQANAPVSTDYELPPVVADVPVVAHKTFGSWMNDARNVDALTPSSIDIG